MARKELRHCDILLRDGLSGTALIDDAGPPMETDTTLTIDAVVLNTDDTDLVPVGARFKVAGETDTDQVHVVTARDPAGDGPTTEITFTPALGPGTYADDGVITFQAQELTIKVGDGTISWSEAKEYEYELDRGDLDTVRETDQQPMEVDLEFVFESVTAGTGESITPVDALKRKAGASEWVNAATDPCEPFAVDMEIVHTPPCGGADIEEILFPDFRYESLEYDLTEATIAVSGRCNATEPTVTRTPQS